MKKNRSILRAELFFRFIGVYMISQSLLTLVFVLSIQEVESHFGFSLQILLLITLAFVAYRILWTKSYINETSVLLFISAVSVNLNEVIFFVPPPIYLGIGFDGQFSFGFHLTILNPFYQNSEFFEHLRINLNLVSIFLAIGFHKNLKEYKWNINFLRSSRIQEG